MEQDDPKLPPLEGRISIVKLFLELGMFNEALLVLNGIMAEDDQDVEAWYLEGWCFFMMAERARENGGALDDSELTFENLARDARDCLEACRTVCRGLFICPFSVSIGLLLLYTHPPSMRGWRREVGVG